MKAIFSAMISDEGNLIYYASFKAFDSTAWMPSRRLPLLMKAILSTTNVWRPWHRPWLPQPNLLGYSCLKASTITVFRPIPWPWLPVGLAMTAIIPSLRLRLLKAWPWLPEGQAVLAWRADNVFLKAISTAMIAWRQSRERCGRWAPTPRDIAGSAR